MVLCGISTCFQVLSPCLGQIVHALLTRPPLEHEPSSRNLPFHVPARLACVKHAASVRPEPGSNSYVQSLSSTPAYSRTARQSRSLSPFRQGVSLFQNLTVVDASSHLPALFVNILLVQNDFLCIVFKDRSLSFASLADSLIIITNTPYVVNPFFATFRLFNILRPFLSLFSSIMLPKSLFPQIFILLSCLFPSIIEISVAHGHKCKERFL